MAYGTIIQQGSFTGTGNAVNLALRSDVDWMQVINMDAIAGNTINKGVRYFWQRGMAINNGVVEYHVAGDQTVSISTSATLGVPGFILLDTSVTTPSAPIATAVITDVVAPVVSTATTTGITVGSIVRITNDATVPNICGIDFQVGAINPGVTFTVAYNLANSPGAAGTGGFYRIIAPSSSAAPWYPKNRTVCNISKAANAVITTTVSNNFTVGQKVRFRVPAVMGMIEMDGLTGTVLTTAAGSFTVNIDSTSFTTFVWPAVGLVPFTPAEVVPVGMDSAVSSNDLTDATINTSYIGMTLGGGAESPAGENGQTIFWMAGKSENV